MGGGAHSQAVEEKAAGRSQGEGKCIREGEPKTQR